MAAEKSQTLYPAFCLYIGEADPSLKQCMHLTAEGCLTRRTYNGVNLVDEDDGGGSKARTLEGVAQQGLALAHVHGEQLRPRQRLQPHRAAPRRCLCHPRLAAPCAANALYAFAQHAVLAWGVRQRGNAEPFGKCESCRMLQDDHRVLWT